LVALAWRENTTPAHLQAGGTLFAENCAACHGESGQGDGPAARYLTDPPPADFTDSERMAAASGVILHGKLVRGGMGTGMPYWGPIFTEDEQWALVDYLWSSQRMNSGHW
jgi:high-affinity iron transporter